MKRGDLYVSEDILETDDLTANFLFVHFYGVDGYGTLYRTADKNSQ